jgi:hypothetical protein
LRARRIRNHEGLRGGHEAHEVRTRAVRVSSLSAGADSSARVQGEDVRLTATVTRARGGRVRSEAAPRMRSEPGLAGYTTVIPLAALAPSDYVLTLEARAGRRTTTRQVPFSVGEDHNRACSVRSPDLRAPVRACSAVPRSAAKAAVLARRACLGKGLWDAREPDQKPAGGPRRGARYRCPLLDDQSASVLRQPLTRG